MATLTASIVPIGVGVGKYAWDEFTNKQNKQNQYVKSELDYQKDTNDKIRKDMDEIAKLGEEQQDILEHLKQDLQAINDLKTAEAVDKEHVNGTLQRYHEQALAIELKINELEKTQEMIRNYLRQQAIYE